MSTDTFVQSFEHLRDKPNSSKALHMLQRIASLVKPIMRKRSWVLPVLAEFFPDNPNLLGLNVNMGEKILVRLRPPYSPDTFLGEEDVVQTMLHELTHNVHGPHDDKFYKYLSGLQDEYDSLKRSGYAGEGFFTPGHRLGTNISHNVPPHLARAKALEAAEKRLKTSRVLGGSGKLGGPSRNTGLSPRELAARAAERRLKDEKSCVSGVNAQREADKAAKQSFKSNVIDLTLYDEHHHRSGSDSDVIIVENTHPVRFKKVTNAAASSSKDTKRGVAQIQSDGASTDNIVAVGTTPNVKGSPKSATKPRQLEHAENDPLEWPCLACTLLNPVSAVQCDACGTRKALNNQEGWSCLVCGEAGIRHDFWTCSWCGSVKASS